MPSHWGLGMFANAGDTYDSDWQSTADRLMFITGIRSWDLYFGAAWDFANEGPTSASFGEQDGQPYDLGQSDDVDQWVFVVVRRMNDAAARKLLRDGSPVFEGGAYVVYRQQQIANDTSTDSGASLGQDSSVVASGYTRRGAQAVIPDGWFRFRFDEFRFEAETAFIYGGIDNTLPSPGTTNFGVGDPALDETGWNIRQWGLATEASYDALDRRLHIGLKFGIASGDSDVEGLAPIGNGLQPQKTLDRTFSTFRFHPDYRVDLILFRNILTRVQGAYYFRPSVGYDFIKDPDGQKAGGDAAVIWSRASEFVQTPGNARDLGVELNFRLYYQARDGVLNDDEDKMGGFFTSLQYGVLFPLGGLGYLPNQIEDYAANPRLPADDEGLDTATAQTLRWYLGILF
ncbi:MAG: TIGR04551 family protein, partial [Myxococcales bacterium]|nr:TIGR04551 family protein [Myxococcales bacterium]